MNELLIEEARSIQAREVCTEIVAYCLECIRWDVAGRFECRYYCSLSALSSTKLNSSSFFLPNKDHLLLKLALRIQFWADLVVEV